MIFILVTVAKGLPFRKEQFSPLTGRSDYILSICCCFRFNFNWVTLVLIYLLFTCSAISLLKHSNFYRLKASVTQNSFIEGPGSVTIKQVAKMATIAHMRASK